MLPEVQHAGTNHCGRLLRDFPGDGRDGHHGDGRRTPRTPVQLAMERRAQADPQVRIPQVRRRMPGAVLTLLVRPGPGSLRKNRCP